MSSQSSDEENRGSYFLDAESSAEMARLLGQDRLLTQAMGGVLAEQQDLSGVKSVLDLACGPGGWVQDLAREHPDIEVYGVDISHLMIEYANALAKSQRLSNAHFLEMDVALPLDFPDASFDLINVRYLIGFLRASRWPDLFLECKRLLRPSGVFRITEPELGSVTSSAAVDRMTIWLIQALQKVGQSFSPDGRRTATIAAIPSLFRRTGYEYQGWRTHLIEFSAGQPAYDGLSEDCRLLYKVSQPFFVQTGVATQEELDQTYAQMLEELQDPDFYGTRDLHTFWGRKPL
jgi:ubiquinone/menaquinone biosynthesis C-methylase UbiE